MLMMKKLLDKNDEYFVKGNHRGRERPSKNTSFEYLLVFWVGSSETVISVTSDIRAGLTH